MSRGGGGRLAAWAVLVALLAAANYAVRFTSGKPAKDTLYQYGTFAGGAVQYLIILAIVLAIAWTGPLRVALALRRPASWGRSLALAVAMLVAVYAVAAALDPLLHPGREQGLTPDRWLPDRAGAFALNVVLFAVFAPIVEELAFRGLGFGLLARFGAPAAIVGTGLAFGLAHGLVDGLPILAIFGCGLAYLRSRTDSVYPGMLVHGVFNGLALALAVTT